MCFTEQHDPEMNTSNPVRKLHKFFLIRILRTTGTFESILYLPATIR